MPSESSERVVFVQRIDPEHREPYLEAHNDVPGDVTNAFRRAGAIDFELYLRDEIAVCVLECEDLNRYLDVVTSDEAVQEWERSLAQYKQEGVDVDAPKNEQIPFMDRIWSLNHD